MRHNKVGKRLGRDAAHRKALKRNLSISLIEHGSIETTLPKAKFVRPFVERLVTKAKDGDLHAIRVLKKKLDNEIAVQKLIDVIGPKFNDRKGGYTRIIKGGYRDGDKAEMARIEWVEDTDSEKAKETKVATKKGKPAEEVVEEVKEDNPEISGEVSKSDPSESEVNDND